MQELSGGCPPKPVEVKDVRECVSVRYSAFDRGGMTVEYHDSSGGGYHRLRVTLEDEV